LQLYSRSSIVGTCYISLQLPVSLQIQFKGVQSILCRLRLSRWKGKNGQHDKESHVPARVDDNWGHCQFLIIDEVLNTAITIDLGINAGLRKLPQISKKLCQAKGCAIPFGGLHVIFCGDFHQLPAVADRSRYHCIEHPSPSQSELTNVGTTLSL
jgi:PIF1-like helicase